MTMTKHVLVTVSTQNTKKWSCLDRILNWNSSFDVMSSQSWSCELILRLLKIINIAALSLCNFHLSIHNRLLVYEFNVRCTHNFMQNNRSAVQCTVNTLYLGCWILIHARYEWRSTPYCSPCLSHIFIIF